MFCGVLAPGLVQNCSQQSHKPSPAEAGESLNGRPPKVTLISLANEQNQANETTRASPCTSNTADDCVARQQRLSLFTKCENRRV